VCRRNTTIDILLVYALEFSVVSDDCFAKRKRNPENLK
jgi:hypothetical protein